MPVLRSLCLRIDQGLSVYRLPERFVDHMVAYLRPCFVVIEVRVIRSESGFIPTPMTAQDKQIALALCYFHGCFADATVHFQFVFHLLHLKPRHTLYSRQPPLPILRVQAYFGGCGDCGFIKTPLSDYFHICPVLIRDHNEN